MLLFLLLPFPWRSPQRSRTSSSPANAHTTPLVRLGNGEAGEREARSRTTTAAAAATAAGTLVFSLEGRLTNLSLENRLALLW